MQEHEKRKRISGKTIIVFFIIMLLITFFSKTMQNMLLPGVNVTNPHPGILIYEARGTGTIVPNETLKIYPESVKKVKEIKVKIGENIKKGQVIAVLAGSTSDKLAEEEININILKEKINKLHLNSQNPQLEVLQLEIEKAQAKKNKLVKELAKKKKLLEVGAETTNQIKEIEYNLEIALKDYEQKKIELENHKRNLLLSQQEREKEIEIMRYEIKLQKLKIDRLKSEDTIISPVNGTVKEIYYQKGQLAQEDQAFCSIINLNKGFIFYVILKREKADFITIGDTISIILRSKNKTIDKPIEKIIFNGNDKELITVIDEMDYLGGEEFEYRIIKRSRSFNTIIPNTALGQDNSGYFVYKIKERDGALGKEYYVEKEYITTGDSDSQNTVVLKGLDNRNSIIYSSDEIINDGSRVWLQQRK